MNSKFKFVLILPFVFLFWKINAQDAKEILALAHHRAEQIQQGYYEVSRRNLFMTQVDTQNSVLKTYFKTIPGDEIFGFAFYMPYTDSIGKVLHQSIYTGNELIRVNYKDSTAVVTSTYLWKDHINDIKHNFNFYSPFITAEGDKLQHEFRPARNYNVQIIGKDHINQHECYHIRVQDFEKSAKNDPVQVLRSEYNYWVDIDDFLVHKYNNAVDLIMNKDTMSQFEEMQLDSFVLFDIPENIPGREIIPSYVELRDYTPYKREPLLSEGSTPPQWSLTSLTGENVTLESLRGKLVLIDFFYKSCYPCMQALPALESLHKKYREQGLVVIGINPFDKDAADLNEFLAKRNVSYKVLLSDKELPKQYKVSGYPTIYLLDESGVIVHAKTGYGEGTEKMLEKIIQENLE